MKIIQALAVVVLPLTAALVYLSFGIPELKLSCWVAFVAWAAYFAAGSGRRGVIRAFSGSVAGVLLGALTMYAVDLAGGGLVVLVVFVAILAFVLVAIANIDVFSYTPACFLGTATFFGAGAKLDETIVFLVLSWLLGILIGYVHEAVGKKIARPT